MSDFQVLRVSSAADYLRVFDADRLRLARLPTFIIVGLLSVLWIWIGQKRRPKSFAISSLDDRSLKTRGQG